MPMRSPIPPIPHVSAKCQSEVHSDRGCHNVKAVYLFDMRGLRCEPELVMLEYSPPLGPIPTHHSSNQPLAQRLKNLSHRSVFLRSQKIQHQLPTTQRETQSVSAFAAVLLNSPPNVLIRARKLTAES